MKIQRQDIIALAVFGVVAVIGLSLWSGQGPLVWLNNFALMCGFG